MEAAYSDKNEKICVLHVYEDSHIVLEKPLLIIKS